MSAAFLPPDGPPEAFLPLLETTVRIFQLTLPVNRGPADKLFILNSARHPDFGEVRFAILRKGPWSSERWASLRDVMAAMGLRDTSAAAAIKAKTLPPEELMSIMIPAGNGRRDAALDFAVNLAGLDRLAVASRGGRRAAARWIAKEVFLAGQREAEAAALLAALAAMEGTSAFDGLPGGAELAAKLAATLAEWLKDQGRP
jgi:hypothetical protein